VPTFERFGSRLLTALADATKLVANPAAQSTPPPIEVDRWARNGRHVDPRLVNAINETANHNVLYRSKEVFRATGVLESSPAGSMVLSSAGAGDRARYRWAFRSGPYCHGLVAVVAMVPPDSGSNRNSYARLDIYSDAAMSVSLVATQTFVYGVSPFGTGAQEAGWQHMKQIFGFVEGLDPDTEYFGVLCDVDDGRIQSACVAELTTLTENGGYLAQNLTDRSAILDVHRQYAAEISNALWQKGGAQVFTFTVDRDANVVTNATNTFKNLINTSVTTVSSASPGYTLNMAGKARLSQTSGVPVVMKVFGASSGNGTIKLVDSGGATVMSISGGWTGTPAWQSVTGYLPASTAKYDLQLSNNGSGTFSVYAVSMYEYG